MKLVTACGTVVAKEVQILGVWDHQEHPTARNPEHLDQTGPVVGFRQVFDNVKSSNQVEGTVRKRK